ncbi:hypothetical protein M9458_030914, partial [Cirrhinus mrigala]
TGNVAFLDAPDAPVSNCPLRVEYSCFQFWFLSIPDLPQSFSTNTGHVNQDVPQLDCLLRAWIGPFPGSSVTVPLDIHPPLSRPFKQHQLCAKWDTDLLWRVRRHGMP